MAGGLCRSLKKRSGVHAWGFTPEDSRSGKHAVGNTQLRGQQAEDRACLHLQAQGLTLVRRNYRLARGPSARGGEIDLIMRASDGTVVFIEVRQRQAATHGGAGASITATKRQRLQRTASHFLMRWPDPPPCRFDVVAIEGEHLHWWPAAFDAQC